MTEMVNNVQTTDFCLKNDVTVKISVQYKTYKYLLFRSILRKIMMSSLDFSTEMTSGPVVSLTLSGLESMTEKSKVLGSLIIPDPLYMLTGRIGMKHLQLMMISIIRLDCNMQQEAGLEELLLTKLLLFVQNLCYQLLKLLKIHFNKNRFKIHFLIVREQKEIMFVSVILSIS